MPVYEYKAISNKGKNISGLRDAENPKALRSVLKGEGIYLTEFFEEKGGQRKMGAGRGIKRDVDLLRFFKRIKLMDIAIMTRQLSTLVGAGIPLAESLKALVDQVENERLKKVLSQVRENVNEGGSFASSLAQHPRVFSDLFINMVTAGESSGNLDVVLERLSDFTENQVKLRAKITGAMMYPIIMLIVGVIILNILFIVVVPKITKIFEDLEVSLPIATEILIAVSHFMSNYWWLALIIIVLAILGFRAWKRTEGGRLTWHRFLLRLPVLGSLIKMIAVSRFSRTLSTLLQSGVPLLSALDIVKNILDNQVLKNALEEARSSIREGESIAAPLKRSGQFPPIVIHMIAVGERSGQLEAMLLNVANAYDVQVDTRVGALTTLLEPLMIVVMGGAVAFIVFSILTPILQLNELVK